MGAVQSVRFMYDIGHVGKVAYNDGIMNTLVTRSDTNSEHQHCGLLLVMVENCFMQPTHKSVRQITLQD